MGAFYQTSSPTQVDYGYQLPAELMAKVIENADAQNDLQLNQLDIMGDSMAKVAFLDKDRERTQQILSGYGSQADALTADLYNNPQDVRKRMGTIRTLGRQLKSDYTSGELAAIMGNRNQYYSWLKDQQARLDKGEIVSSYLDAAKQKYLSEFQGTNYNKETGAYNMLSPGPMAKFVNMQKRAEEYMTGVEKNVKEAKWDDVSGKTLYKVTHEDKDEWVDYTGLMNIAKKAYASDLEAQASVNEGVRLGVIKDGAAFLQSAFDAAADKKAFLNTSRKVTHEGDPVKLQLQQQGFDLQKQKAQWQHEFSMKQWELGNDYDKEKRKFQADLYQSAIANNQDPSKEKMEVPANPYGPALENTVTSDQLSLYGPEELTLPNLRATQQHAQANLDKANKDLADAQASGDPVLISNAYKQISSAKDLINTTAGLLTEARVGYYNSDAFKNLDATMQGHVKAYMDYLSANNLVDAPEVRTQFSKARGIAPTVQGISYPKFGEADVYSTPYVGGPMGGYSPAAGSGKGKPGTFNGAVDDAIDVMNNTMKNAANTNGYAAHGVALNMADPGTYQTFNDMVKYGNVTVYQPGNYGGQTGTGQERNLSDMKLDVGKGWWTDEGPMSITGLLKATNQQNLSALSEKVVALPSPEPGKLRFKIQLKPQAPDGKTIGNGAMNYYQIEGMNDNRELVIEVQGPSSTALLNSMKTNANPAARVQSYVLTDPGMADLRRKFLVAMAPPPEVGGWGAYAPPFSTGSVSFEVRRHSTGAAEVMYNVSPTPGTYSWYQVQYATPEEAEADIMHVADNLNNGSPEIKKGTIEALKAASSRTGK
jgi:hypothetical protein